MGFGEVGLFFFALDLELIFCSPLLAAMMAREERGSEDKEKVDHQVDDHKRAGHVANLKLDDDIVDPGSED